MRKKTDEEFKVQEHQIKLIRIKYTEDVNNVLEQVL